MLGNWTVCVGHCGFVTRVGNTGGATSAETDVVVSRLRPWLADDPSAAAGRLKCKKIAGDIFSGSASTVVVNPEQLT